jgi:Ca-activated chloride channel family protein
MAGIRYSRYEGPEEQLDLVDLLGMLQERLLESGFSNDPWDPDPLAGQTFEDLLEAIAASLIENDLLPDGVLAEARQADNWLDSRLGEMARRLAERLEQEGFVRSGTGPGEGASAGTAAELRFELTDKSIDFLGYRSLRDLLGAAAGRSLGAHDTRLQNSGVTSAAETRPYEFGDSMNLDMGETFRSAARHGVDNGRLKLQAGDLHVVQGEHQAAAATVLMLDCSHSMILYGEDRFTPAKKVALALAHLIRNQFRGDSLNIVLFHDTAEEIPLQQLAGTQVGPYHTNTAEGLRLAQRLLQRQNRDMKQIIMITDGKPSAITLPDGRIYKNAYGLDPLVLGETLREAGNCRRRGIQINTFMLARDPELLAFVRRITAMTRGKSYLTSAGNVGSYVLQDYRTRRSKVVN